MCGSDGTDPTAGMSAREKKLWELQQRLRQSRKANQMAVVAEKKRLQKPEGHDSAAAKKNWFEEKKKRKADDLARLGLDSNKVALLIHQERG
jgi:pre-mRNA-splicing factor SYF2